MVDPVKWLLLPLTALLAVNVVLGLAYARRWRLRHADPKPPENVRVIDPTGTEIPVQCVYAGRAADGMHEWEVIRPRAIVDVTDVRSVAVDVFPAHTRIIIQGRIEDT